ncbi:MAG: 4-alpha-glucanotransferase [Verrucomicrobiota bacterium]|nr:4-alpha-glucanotransferase [Verrucomicrobiota bacterium]
MFLSPEQKLAGVLAPLFALRGKDDLGIGDLGALREFVHWAADHGFGIVQLLPINETGSDNSPYNAISSVALEPATIETTPEALPDLTPQDFAEITGGAGLEQLRAGPVVYPLIKALKRDLLARAFQRFLAGTWKRNEARARQFRAFMKAEAAWLDGYALFRVLMDRNAGTERWTSWPPQQQTLAKARIWLGAQRAALRREIEREVRFVMWLQWIAWTQWRAFRLEAASLGVALMGDVPFGVSYYSADVFFEPKIFDHRWSGGAPPETLFKDDAFTQKWGQNWGVPLYRWDVLRKRNFDWWRRRVAKVREIFHLFRIDHVLGFYRIYAFPWRPERNAEFLPLSPEEAMQRTGGDLPGFREHDDETPAGKAANRAQGEKLLRVLLEECGEYRLIGEDLGTVPDYVRPSLLALHIAGFRVPFWEGDWDQRLRPGDQFDRLSVATFATHDHEPLRAMWDRWMRVIAEAERQPKELGAQRDATWWEVRRLAEWAGFDVPCIQPFESVHEKLLCGLFRCNSWLAILMITDLLGSAQRFNVPGAMADSNWSLRMEDSVARWREDAKLGAKLARVRHALRETHRLAPR